MNKNLIIVITIVLMSAGCVATHDDMGNIYARQAKLEADNKKLSQKIDDLQYESGSRGSISDDHKILELESRVTSLERSYERLVAMLQRSDRMTTLNTPDTSEIDRPVDSNNAMVFAPTDVDQEAVIFNRAYKYLSENKYDEARQEFSQFLQKYPQSPQSSDAAFWIAESYFRQGQYEEAILDFQKFIEDYEKDIKVPLAYYKQGESLLSIDRKQEAVIFFQTLIDKFPQSDEARSAKEKLRALE